MHVAVLTILVVLPVVWAVVWAMLALTMIVRWCRILLDTKCFARIDSGRQRQTQ